MKDIPMKYLQTAVISLLVLVCFGLCLHYIRLEVVSFQSRLDTIAESQEKMSAGIGYNSRRKKIILSLYNEIIKSNPKLSKDLAFKIAEYDYQVSAEIYKSFDPFLLFAIQWKETGGQFDPSVRSPAGAVGLNQIMPLTGRWLARGMRIEWSDDLLTDPYRNIDLAANYLDFLFGQLKDEKQVLAYYNGGEKQYRFVKNGQMDSVCTETRVYIAKVLEYRDRIRLMDEDVVEAPSQAVPVKPEKKIPKPIVKIPAPTPNIVVDSAAENG